MASRRRGRSRTGSRESKKKRKNTGKKRVKRTEKKHNKWFQRGCQNQTGGSSISGGWPANISDIQPTRLDGDATPQAINGNHYVFNANTMPHPQASNALVERANYVAMSMSGGSKRRTSRYHRRNKRQFRKGTKIACQTGGAAEYLPDVAANYLRGIVDAGSGFIHGLQGPPTPYISSDPTVQPISNTSVLK